MTKPKFQIQESVAWLTPDAFPEVRNIGKNKVIISGTALKGGAISRNRRKYVEEELPEAAGTYRDRKPVTINHNDDRIVGHTLWGKYNQKTRTVEYAAEVNKQPYVTWLKSKDPRIKGVSVQAGYLHNRCVYCGQKFYSEEDFKGHMITEHQMKNLFLNLTVCDLTH